MATPASDRTSIEFVSSYSRSRTAVALPVGEEFVVGMDSGCTVVLEGPDVQSRHAQLRVGREGLQVTPLDGAPVAVNGHPIFGPYALNDGDWLSLGASLFQIRLPQPAAAPVKSKPPQAVLTIGRLPQCDLSIPSPLVSREHARLHCLASGVELEDLGSTNGTFVNGQRITGRVQLRQGDRIAIASFGYLFTGESLEAVDTSGRVRVEVRGLYKEVVDRSSKQPRRLLDDVSLVIEPGEFVVLFGTSGSGKSTLLDALNGRRPATGGQVLYNGADFYGSYDAFRAAIGYVPQQDIVHRKITVEDALKYTARLRLPPDTSDQEIGEYIRRVLSKVELAEKARLPIDTPAPLSGGQLKRVSLAVELVANPNILFLDEVTSGLDAGTDKRMMRLFADLAADQKTVICVTHTLENIDVCHLVVLLHKGRLVYYGPPGEAAGYFGLNRLSDVYELLESSPANEWAERYLQSRHYQTYVVGRLGNGGGAASGETSHTALLPGSRAPWFDWRQGWTLMRRYFDLIVSDRKNLLILLLQAPLIGLVIGLVFSTEGAPPARAAAESTIAFILVLSAIWFGTLNSARELVKELPIYQRERSVNLGIAPYLASKLVPLAVLCVIQCLLLLGIVSALVDLPGSFPVRTAALFLTGMAATAMGLAVSAFVDSNDKAVAMAPILLIPQVVLANAIVQLGKTGLWVAKSSMVSFWALDAMKTTLSEESRSVRDLTGRLIVPISGHLGGDLAMVALMGSVFLGIAVLGLRLKDRRQ